MGYRAPCGAKAFSKRWKTAKFGTFDTPPPSMAAEFSYCQIKTFLPLQLSNSAAAPVKIILGRALCQTINTFLSCLAPQDGNVKIVLDNAKQDS